MKKKNWYPLDNAAKIYPPNSNYRRAGNFALVAVMKDTVNPQVLNEAVNNILKRFPTFDTKLKKGIFWYYLEENTKPFLVLEEDANFMKYIENTENNGFLFKVFYRENKITLVIFHALSDGTGGIDFLKALIYEYLVLSGCKIKSEGLLKTPASPVVLSEIKDDFKEVYTKKGHNPPKEKSAFRPEGTAFSYDGIGIITAKINTEQLKQLTKKYNVTITVMLAALYMDCVYKAFIKDQKVKNKLVKLLIPVNMRKWYPSETLRNFAMFVRLGYDYENPITLDECVKICDEQLKDGLTYEKLSNIVYSNVKTEKNWALKIMPLFIKDIALKIAYRIVGDNLHTANLSNLGVVTLPESVRPFVKDIVFILNASYSGKMNASLVGFGDHINMTFSRNIVENKLEREFIRYLTSQGIDVEVDSNYWEGKA